MKRGPSGHLQQWSPTLFFLLLWQFIFVSACPPISLFNTTEDLTQERIKTRLYFNKEVLFLYSVWLYNSIS